MTTMAMTTQTKVGKQALLMIGMLSAQLLLGMAENLIGKPSETQGTNKAFSGIILALHAVIGIGLVVRGSLLLRLALRENSQILRLARIGLVGVLIAFIAGALTMAITAGDSWWSYLMTIGFLVAFLTYSALSVPARTSKS